MQILMSHVEPLLADTHGNRLTYGWQPPEATWMCARMPVSVLQRLWNGNQHLSHCSLTVLSISWQVKQLPGIGKLLGQRLKAAGAGTLRQLAELDPRRIETITQRNYPFGDYNGFFRLPDIILPGRRPPRARLTQRLASCACCDSLLLRYRYLLCILHCAGNQVKKELQSRLPADVTLHLTPTSEYAT